MDMKYKIGDVVDFRFGDDILSGVIWIADKCVFEEPGPHYDIFVEDKNCLYKHISEERIVRKTGEFTEE